MSNENKRRLVRFLWNVASAILAAIGTALGVSCTMGWEHQMLNLHQQCDNRAARAIDATGCIIVGGWHGWCWWAWHGWWCHGPVQNELHPKATMRKRRGQRSSKQGKRQERSTTCGVFLAIQIKMAIFAYLKLYSQNNTWTSKQNDMTNEEAWNINYQKVYAFVERNHRAPSRHRTEEHTLLNWLKYNRKCLNKDKMQPQRKKKFVELLELIRQYHRVNQYKWTRVCALGQSHHAGILIYTVCEMLTLPIIMRHVNNIVQCWLIGL